MPTSTKTRLELINSVLTSVGERPLTASSGTLGTLATDSVKEALIDVCTGNGWNELRDSIVGTWSGDTATLDPLVYRVQGVTWYSSPTGSALASYDYPRYALRFITLDEYLRYPLIPYTNSEPNQPKFYTIEGVNTIRVNPYPNDATERNKITFDVYKLVSYPVSDSSNFSCSDQLLNLVQYKASALLALKFLGDAALAENFEGLYEKFRRKIIIADSGYPTGGYNIFRGKRR